MRTHNLAGALASVALAAALSAGGMATAAEPERGPGRTVSVSATGSVAAEPDHATISIGVVSEAETAREALARNSATMVKVIDGLKGLGISAQDIRTTAINVEPSSTLLHARQVANFDVWRRGIRGLPQSELG